MSFLTTPPHVHTKEQAELEGEPGEDFWAIVAISFFGERGDCEAHVLKQSDDCRTKDIFINGGLTSDNGDDLEWVPETAGPSVYRIEMNPLGDEDDFDLNVVKAELLWELPA
jgi:hypothetical protein